MSSNLDSLKKEFEQFVGKPVSADEQTIFSTPAPGMGPTPHDVQIVPDYDDPTYKAARELADKLKTQFSFASQIVAGVGGTQVIAQLEKRDDGIYYISDVEASFC